jgi:hypothetical protein
MGIAKNKGGLGFWDLILFNKTLLAKQVWILSQHLDSLVAKIFKAKYYTSYLVLEAGIGKKPSLVWRSLTSAQEVIKRGQSGELGMARVSRCGGIVDYPPQCLFRSNPHKQTCRPIPVYLSSLTKRIGDGMGPSLKPT